MFYDFIYYLKGKKLNADKFNAGKVKCLDVLYVSISIYV